jgi:hypothetical protein
MKPHRGDGDEREPTERRRLPRELELELEAESTKGSLLQKFVDLGLCMHVTGATPHFEPTSNFVQLGLLIPETGSLKLGKGCRIFIYFLGQVVINSYGPYARKKPKLNSSTLFGNCPAKCNIPSESHSQLAYSLAELLLK